MEKEICHCDCCVKHEGRIANLESELKRVDKIEKLAVELYHKAKKNAEELHAKSEEKFKQLEPFLWQKRKPISLRVIHSFVNIGIAWDILLMVIIVSVIDTYNSKWFQYGHLDNNLQTLLIEIIKFLQKF